MLVGEDPASKVYVGMKEKKCAEVGIKAVDRAPSRRHIPGGDPGDPGRVERGSIGPRHPRPASPSGSRRREDGHGAYPAREGRGRLSIRSTSGRLASGDPDAFRPCTPAGVQVMLQHIGYDPAGKHAVIVGRSNIVGRPMAAILSQKAPWANATVTMAHSRSQDLGAITRSADLLIVAVGWPNAVTGDMVSEGTVVDRRGRQPGRRRHA